MKKKNTNQKNNSRVNLKVNLIIFPGNYLPNIGGLETHVDEYANYQSQNSNYSITIFTPDVKNSKTFESKFNNVKIIRYPALYLTSNFPFPKLWNLKFWKLYCNLYKNKYDIVMSRTRFFSNTTLATVFAKLRLKPLILMHVEHGSSYVDVGNKIVNSISYIYDQIFGKLTFFLANKIVAVSYVSQKFVNESFTSKHVQVIQRGIDFTKYDTISRDFKNFKYYESITKNKFVILSLCRLYKWKGVENSLKAFLNLPKEIRKDYVYLIGGNGEELENLKSIAKDEINKSVFILGEVKFDENSYLFNKADIFMHSSYPGGALSSSLLQAMYCKCSIVASPNEGADEVINSKTGILLKDNSIKNLQKGMRMLIEDKNLRKTYSKEAHLKIKKEFAWEIVVKKYEKEFNKLLNKK